MLPPVTYEENLLVDCQREFMQDLEMAYTIEISMDYSPSLSFFSCQSDQIVSSYNPDLIVLSI